MKPKVLLVIVITVFVLSAIYLLTQINEGNNSLPNTNVQNPTISPPDESLGIVLAPPEGWKMFQDSNLNIRLHYPESLQFQKSGEQSVIFSPISNKPEQGLPTFFYVSVITDSLKNTGGEIYNYRLEDLQKLNTLKINEKTSLTENRQLNEWYTYERLTDRQISGIIAKQYVNLKPWEFPEGTRETRYILEKDKTVYLIGAYYQPGNKILSKEDLSQILDSITITTPGQEILE